MFKKIKNLFSKVRVLPVLAVLFGLAVLAGGYVYFTSEEVLPPEDEAPPSFSVGSMLLRGQILRGHHVFSEEDKKLSAEVDWSDFDARVRIGGGFYHTTEKISLEKLLSPKDCLNAEVEAVYFFVYGPGGESGMRSRGFYLYPSVLAGGTDNIGITNPSSFILEEGRVFGLVAGKSAPSKCFKPHTEFADVLPNLSEVSDGWVQVAASEAGGLRTLEDYIRALEETLPEASYIRSVWLQTRPGEFRDRVLQEEWTKVLLSGLDNKLMWIRVGERDVVDDPPDELEPPPKVTGVDWEVEKYDDLDLYEDGYDLTLSWDEVDYDEDYYYEVYEDDDPYESDIKGVSILIEGLDAEEVYFFKVRAVAEEDDDKAGDFSDSIDTDDARDILVGHVMELGGEKMEEVEKVKNCLVLWIESVEEVLEGEDVQLELVLDPYLVWRLEEEEDDGVDELRAKLKKVKSSFEEAGNKDSFSDVLDGVEGLRAKLDEVESSFEEVNNVFKEAGNRDSFSAVLGGVNEFFDKVEEFFDKVEELLSLYDEKIGSTKKTDFEDRAGFPEELMIQNVDSLVIFCEETPAGPDVERGAVRGEDLIFSSD